MNPLFGPPCRTVDRVYLWHCPHSIQSRVTIRCPSVCPTRPPHSVVASLLLWPSAQHGAQFRFVYFTIHLNGNSVQTDGFPLNACIPIAYSRSLIFINIIIAYCFRCKQASCEIVRYFHRCLLCFRWKIWSNASRCYILLSRIIAYLQRRSLLKAAFGLLGLLNLDSTSSTSATDCVH